MKFIILVLFFFISLPSLAMAAITPLTFTLNMSEIVTVDTTGGTPTLTIDVGGVSRTATFTSGSGTNALVFSYTPVVGDVDMDGITLTSPITLNGATIKDNAGNDIPIPASFTLPTTTGIKINYPSLSMDFINDRYTLNGTAHNSFTTFLSNASGTFTRASVGTYYDSTGTLQTATANTPRFDHDPTTNAARGILIEESRTNQVKNSQFQGASVGVTPSNITVSNGGAGIVASVSGVGVINGENYIEVQFSGTSSAGAQIYPAVSFASNIVAAQGEIWTGSVRIISDTGTSSVNPYMELTELSAAGAYLAGTTSSLTGGSAYKILTRTLNNASTAKTRFIMVFSLAPGQSINRTFRFSIPQFEKGAFRTSYIPTTTAAVTRAADDFYIPTGTWTGSSIGTLSSESAIPYLGGTSYPGPLAMNDTTSLNAVECLVNDGATDAKGSNIYSAGSQIYGSTQSTYVQSNTLKCTIAYQNNNVRAAIDGVLGGTGSSLTIPALTRLSIGTNRASSSKLNGWVKNAKYYPLRVTDTQLQLMTQ